MLHVICLVYCSLFVRNVHEPPVWRAQLVLASHKLERVHIVICTLLHCIVVVLRKCVVGGCTQNAYAFFYSGMMATVLCVPQTEQPVFVCVCVCDIVH